MTIPITGLYVGLTIILATVLSARIGWYRAKVGISILHNDNMEVAQRMRVHGNLMETAALTLLAMAVIEINGAGSTLLHGLGIAYILSRVAHAIGLKHDNIRHPLRAIGAMGSTLVGLVAAGVAISQYF
ncbi:MAG: MAPEG family protein [Acidimicrobiales bacterium]|nr:MAPEG family protein [Hyphomonadaceae bacterium]RZV42063.1 MAG: MAPEG family protein [Acidimicrobiales bacterium]